MIRRLLNAAMLAAAFVAAGSGCRLCDRYCDRRDSCDSPRFRADAGQDPCGNPPPVRLNYADDGR